LPKVNGKIDFFDLSWGWDKILFLQGLNGISAEEYLEKARKMEI
jgi:hypothetical protein